jgi:hypothetical protein
VRTPVAVTGFDDQAGFVGDDGAVEGLQADQARATQQLAGGRLLPGQLGPAEEVVLVQLDQRAEAGAEAAGQAVGVLADDEVPLLQAQDALRRSCPPRTPGRRARSR